MLILLCTMLCPALKPAVEEPWILLSYAGKEEATT